MDRTHNLPSDDADPGAGPAPGSDAPAELDALRRRIEELVALDPADAAAPASEIAEALGELLERVEGER